MKQARLLIAGLALVLSSLACEQQEPQPADYTIQMSNKPLSGSEIASAFDMLGLDLVRFTCMLPKGTRISVASEVFVDGKADEGGGGGVFPVGAGLHEFILFRRVLDDDSIEFMFKSGGAGIQCGSASLEGYPSAAYRAIDIQELTEERQPIYIYTADKPGGVRLEAFSADPVDIEACASEHEFVMVVYVSLKPE